MLKVAALILLVALILLGALLPLKYTARMHLPKRPGVPPQRAGDAGRGADADDRRSD